MRLQEVLKGKSGLKKRSRYKMRPISQGLRKIELFCQLRAMGYPEKYEQDFDEEIKRLHSEGNVDEAKRPALSPDLSKNHGGAAP